MYIPKYFQLKDHGKIISFMKEYNFALLISSNENEITGTHLPFIIEEDDNNITLITHLARANSHWNLLDGEKESLVVFQGPHAYISTQFYEHRQNVPTWNYTAIHVYGIPRLITAEEEMIGVLQKSFDSFDPAYKSQWDELPEKYRNGLLKGIVAVEIAVTKIQAKFKLSQNRSVSEQERIIDSFEKSDDYLLTGIANLMQENLKTIESNKNRSY